MKVVSNNINDNTKSVGQAKCSAQVKSQSLLVQAVALAGVGVFAYWEFITNNSTILLLQHARSNPYLLGMGIVDIGIILAVALMTLFLVAQGKLINNNTPALPSVFEQLLSAESRATISDLLVKYCFLVVIVSGGAPERLAAALILFIADYLIKGSYFSIPQEVSIPLGVACTAAAFTLVIYQGSSLLWAFSAFAVVGAISAAYRFAADNSQVEASTSMAEAA